MSHPKLVIYQSPPSYQTQLSHPLSAIISQRYGTHALVFTVLSMSHDFQGEAVMMFHAPSFSQQFSINVPSFVYHVPSMFHHFPTDFGGLNTQWRFSRATVGSPGPLVAPLRPVASGRSRSSVSASAGADAVSRSGAAWLVNHGILRVI